MFKMLQHDTFQFTQSKHFFPCNLVDPFKIALDVLDYYDRRAEKDRSGIILVQVLFLMHETIKTNERKQNEKQLC